MDVYCVKCGEPWDIDSIHEEAAARQDMGAPQASFTVVRDDFYTLGCSALSTAFGVMECETNERSSATAMAMSAMVDLMGDDIDGIASMMEDFGGEW